MNERLLPVERDSDILIEEAVKSVLSMLAVLAVPVLILLASFA